MGQGGSKDSNHFLVDSLDNSIAHASKSGQQANAHAIPEDRFKNLIALLTNRPEGLEQHRHAGHHDIHALKQGITMITGSVLLINYFTEYWAL